MGQAFSLGASQHPIFPQLREDAEGFVGECADLTQKIIWNPLRGEFDPASL